MNVPSPCFFSRFLVSASVSFSLSGCPSGDDGSASTSDSGPMPTSTMTGDDGLPPADSSTSMGGSEPSTTEVSDGPAQTDGPTSASGDDGLTGTETAGVDPCEVCGRDGCLFVSELDAECIAAGVHCIPPAPEACETCMQQACPDFVGDPGRNGYDEVDLAAVIGGCGDARPYAAAYDCMAQSCQRACTPGAGFTECVCA